MLVCSSCGAEITVPSEAAGTSLLCPECDEHLTVPVPSPTARRPSSKTLVLKRPEELAQEAPKASVAKKKGEPEFLPVVMAAGWGSFLIGLAGFFIFGHSMILPGVLLSVTLLAGIVLLAHGRLGHGLFLLLMGGLTLAGLNALSSAREGTEGHAAPSSSLASHLPPRSTAGAPNTAGRTSLAGITVRVERAGVPVRKEPAKAPPAPTVSEPPPAPPAYTEQEPLPRPAESAQNLPSRKDPYAELLENRAVESSYAADETMPEPPSDLLVELVEQPPQPEQPLPAKAPEALAKEFVPPQVSFPFVIYRESGEAEGPYVPSGYMGNMDAISMEMGWTENPRSGKTCIKAVYNSDTSWGGVAWQNPENNWGSYPGGFNLTGAKQLRFWARVDEGAHSARITFKLGLGERRKAPYDSACIALEKAKVTSKWKEFAIPLKGQDLCRIITGFSWVVEGEDRPVTFYLDDIVVE